MISTNDLTLLPGRKMLRQICKSISVLDAVFAEDWLNRYYSFNSKWSATEEFFGMRNGEGDEVLILFQNNGCVINGMAHEYYPKDKINLTKELPEKYHEFIFGEPVNSIGTTFCIWTDSDSYWTTGHIADFNDGSSDVLNIFDSDPKTYLTWAIDYYELNSKRNTSILDIINNIYQGKPITKSMIYTLNSDFKHWNQLYEDLIEIDFPFIKD